MKKKVLAGIIAAVSMFNMLFVCAGVQANGTQVYQYRAEDAVAAGTLDTASYGITRGDNVYGAGKTTKLGKDLFYWYSTKGANTGFTKAVTVNLANDNKTSEILNAGNEVVKYEFIFALYATISKEGEEGVRFELNATDTKETSVYRMLDMAVRRNGSSTQGLLYVVGQEDKGVGIVTAEGKEPARFMKLTMYFNMADHTASVYYTPLGTDAVTPEGDTKVLAENAVFQAGDGERLKPCQLSVYVKYNGSGEAIYPVSIQTTALSAMGEQAVRIEPEQGAAGNAIGFYAQEQTEAAGRKYGFKLTGDTKEAWYRMNVNQPEISGGAQVRYGIILEDETGMQDLSGISAQVYYTEQETE